MGEKTDTNLWPTHAQSWFFITFKASLKGVRLELVPQVTCSAEL